MYSKKVLVQIAQDLHQAVGKYNLPGLTPRDQAELVAMGIRTHLKELRPALVFGRVWVSDRQVTHPTMRKYSGMKFLPDHFWVEIGNKIILDFSFREVVDQDHESIPGGIFTRGTFKGFIHEVDQEIRFRTTVEAMEEIIKKSTKPKTSDVI